MITKHRFRDLISKINWEAYFIGWGYDRKFASIASVEGCDVVRATWLTDFTPSERAKASEAMQLLKETYRLLEQLDRDYEILTICKSVQTLPTDIQTLVSIESHPNAYTLISGAADPEIDLLYDNNEINKRIVRSITYRLVEAAILSIKEGLGDNLTSFSIDPQTKNSTLWAELDQLLHFKDIHIQIQGGRLNPLSAQCAVIL